MRRSLLPAVLSLSLLLSTLATAHAAQNASSGREIFTSFDVPGAIETSAVSINPAGVIVGSYTDAGFVGHGFVWYPDGTIVSFDAPVASPMGPPLPSDINPAGQIVGFYSDAAFVNRGFVRSPH